MNLNGNSLNSDKFTRNLSIAIFLNAKLNRFFGSNQQLVNIAGLSVAAMQLRHAGNVKTIAIFLNYDIKF